MSMARSKVGGPCWWRESALNRSTGFDGVTLTVFDAGLVPPAALVAKAWHM